MESKFKANLMIFLTITILALGVAFICETFTGSVMNPYMVKFLPHQTDKLGIIADGDFSPEQIKTVELNIVTPVNETNTTVDNTTDVEIENTTYDDTDYNSTDIDYSEEEDVETVTDTYYYDQ